MRLAVIVQGSEGGGDALGIPGSEDEFVGLCLSEELLGELEAEAGGAASCDEGLGDGAHGCMKLLSSWERG